MTTVLKDLKLVVESDSYIDAMFAVLSHRGLIACTKPVLAGMTASAFRLVVDRRLTAESPTAYNWMAEHFLAADFIGVTSSQAAGFTFDATFPLYRMDAIRQIKAAIDSGAGAILWQDRFTVAAGYDDERQCLLLCTDRPNEWDSLPYEAFGGATSPYWYWQRLDAGIELDEVEIYKESLMQAISKWETHDPMLPEEVYACGKAAYEAIITALRQGDYDREAAAVVFRCYAAGKRDAAQYMEELANYWPVLAGAADRYRETELAFREAAMWSEKDSDLTDSGTAIGTADVEPRLAEIIALFAAAEQAEERAIAAFKSLMRETLDIRSGDIALR